MAMNFKPVGWTVLVEEVKRENGTTLIIPDTAKDASFLKHIVVDVGDPRITADGREVPIPVKIGDDIRFNDQGGPRAYTRLDPHLFGGRELFVIDCEWIKGVFTGEPDRQPARKIVVAKSREAALVH